mmetsp:Transcript_49810/g.131656  ORF Transcript_49810/g.131656 Transcript_49810/m.131656 type:complete len:263 (+) Transcript_49810:132-920(+)
MALPKPAGQKSPSLASQTAKTAQATGPLPKMPIPVQTRYSSAAAEQLIEKKADAPKSNVSLSRSSLLYSRAAASFTSPSWRPPPLWRRAARFCRRLRQRRRRWGRARGPRCRPRCRRLWVRRHRPRPSWPWPSRPWPRPAPPCASWPASRKESRPPRRGRRASRPRLWVRPLLPQGEAAPSAAPWAAPWAAPSAAPLVAPSAALSAAPPPSCAAPSCRSCTPSCRKGTGAMARGCRRLSCFEAHAGASRWCLCASADLPRAA